jgi:hypothetical protein
MSRGNQREKDREKAQAKAAANNVSPTIWDNILDTDCVCRKATRYVVRHTLFRQRIAHVRFSQEEYVANTYGESSNQAQVSPRPRKSRLLSCAPNRKPVCPLSSFLPPSRLLKRFDTLLGCIADMAVKPRRRRTAPLPSKSSRDLAGLRRSANGNERCARPRIWILGRWEFLRICFDWCC